MFKDFEYWEIIWGHLVFLVISFGEEECLCSKIGLCQGVAFWIEKINMCVSMNVSAWEQHPYGKMLGDKKELNWCLEIPYSLERSLI